MRISLSKFKRRLIIISIAIILSVAMTFILQYIEGTQIEVLTSTTKIGFSNETTFSSPFRAFIKKGYFDSVGKVYVYLSSPYAKYWSTFNVWMSLDNSSWTPVPFLETDTEDLSQMACLGLINLNDPQLTIYVKHYVPPQNIVIPYKALNVTIGEVLEEVFKLKAMVLIKKQATPQDTTNWIIIFFTIFGITGFILDHFFLSKDSNSATETKMKKRKNNSKN